MNSGPWKNSSGIRAAIRPGWLRCFSVTCALVCAFFASFRGRCWRAPLAVLVICTGAGGLPAQTAAAGSGSATVEFRQQLPLGAVTGDARTLRQRILSATSYRMTAGDTYELQIQLGSDRVNSFPLVLQDDYQLEIPYVGTVEVRDRLFSDGRREIVRRIKEQVPARFVSFVLKQPALFDVFIYGGVANPGIYTVTPLSRVSDLITVAGGPQAGSSLRRVELTRDDLTRTIDLTRFSTHGELDANPTLTPADRVRVPRAERLVSVAGSVAFPGVYDLLAGEGIVDLIRFAGGLTGVDSDNRLSVLRGRPVPQVVELGPAQWRTFALRDGDQVEAAPVARTERMVLVQGALFGEPGGAAPRPIPEQPVVVLLPYAGGLTVLQVLERMGGPTPLARAERSSVLRAATGARIAVDAAALWELRDPALDLLLEPGDQLHVPMQDLNIYVAGEVNVPAAVPYQPSLTIGDYLRAAGGLTEDGGASFTVIDADHARSRGTLFTRPAPGSTIIADRNAWAGTRNVLSELAIVAGFTVVVWDLVFKVYDRVTE